MLKAHLLNHHSPKMNSYFADSRPHNRSLLAQASGLEDGTQAGREVEHLQTSQAMVIGHPGKEKVMGLSSLNQP